MFHRTGAELLWTACLGALIVMANGCGHDSSSAEDSSADASADADSGADDTLTLIGYHLGGSASARSLAAAPLQQKIAKAATGGNAWVLAEAGSVIESAKMRLDRFELVDENNQPFVVYEGDEYFEISGSGSGVTGSAIFGKPPVGKYKGIRISSSNNQTKAKVKIGGTWYYTQTATIAAGDPIPMGKSTVEPTADTPDYGMLTAEGASHELVVDFTVPLEVIAERGADIVMMNSTDYAAVSCYVDDTGADPVFYSINPGEGFFAQLPARPDKMVNLFLVARKDGFNDLTNTLILFYGGDTLLGGFCRRPSDGDGTFAINGGPLLAGSTSIADGDQVTFSLRFNAGGMDFQGADRYYVVDGSYLLTGDTGTFTLAGDVAVGSPDLTPDYLEQGYDSLEGATGQVSAETLVF